MRAIQNPDRSRLIAAAMQRIPCDLTIQNIRLVNVITGEIYPAEVDVLDGVIVRVREGEMTAVPSEKVAAPLIAESPVNIECRVRQVLPLGTHDMFVAEVVGVQADEAYIDPATGRFCLERAEPIVYSHGEYFALGDALGRFGWSVRRKRRKQGR